MLSLRVSNPATRQQLLALAAVVTGALVPTGAINALPSYGQVSDVWRQRDVIQQETQGNHWIRAVASADSSDAPHSSSPALLSEEPKISLLSLLLCFGAVNFACGWFIIAVGNEQLLSNSMPDEDNDGSSRHRNGYWGSTTGSGYGGCGGG